VYNVGEDVEGHNAQRGTASTPYPPIPHTNHIKWVRYVPIPVAGTVLADMGAV